MYLIKAKSTRKFWDFSYCWCGEIFDSDDLFLDWMLIEVKFLKWEIIEDWKENVLAIFLEVRLGVINFTGKKGECFNELVKFDLRE